MEKAVKYKWYDFSTFDEKEYNDLKNFDKGDINVIAPNEVVAFSSPISPHLNTTNESVFNKPEVFVPQFKRLQINTIFRFNEKLYEEAIFTENGFTVFDLYFDDGQAPPFEIVDRFLEHVKQSRKGYGFHCKAGLGRTGTMIVIYLCDKYAINAREATAWVKICRPGSINRIQYEFLLKYENTKSGNKRQMSINESVRGLRNVNHNERAKSTIQNKQVRGFFDEVILNGHASKKPQNRFMASTNNNVDSRHRSRSTTPLMNPNTKDRDVGGMNRPMQHFTPHKPVHRDQVENRSAMTPQFNWEGYNNTPIHQKRGDLAHIMMSDIIDRKDKHKYQQNNDRRPQGNIHNPLTQSFITPFTFNNNPTPHQERPTLSTFNPNKANLQISNAKPTNAIDAQQPIKNMFNPNHRDLSRPQPNTPRRPPLKNPAQMQKTNNMPLKNVNSAKEGLYLFDVSELNKHGTSVPIKSPANPLNQKWV